MAKNDRKVPKSSNLAYTVSSAPYKKDKYCKKYGFSCAFWLCSQAHMMVKCKAAIFLPTQDWRHILFTKKACNICNISTTQSLMEQNLVNSVYPLYVPKNVVLRSWNPTGILTFISKFRKVILVETNFARISFIFSTRKSVEADWRHELHPFCPLERERAKLSVQTHAIISLFWKRKEKITGFHFHGGIFSF